MSALLRRRVPFMPDETATSYASRLAACNGTDMASFCRDLGLSLQDLVDGRPAALDRLGELSGTSPLTMCASSFVKVGRERWRVHGQTVSEAICRSRRFRFCPLCASSDMEASTLSAAETIYGRATWSIDQVRTCASHQVGLVDVVAQSPGRGGYDFAQNLAPALSELPHLCDTVARRIPSGLEGYMLKRLVDGRGDSPWLDALDCDVAALTVERVGAVAAFGRRVSFEHLGPEDAWVAGDVGYDILRDGVDGLTRFLDDLARTYERKKSGVEGGNAIYGRLVAWLDRNTTGVELTPVREIFREHVLGRLPIAPGVKLFGRTVTERRIHSVLSAAIEYRIPHKRVRAVLAEEGLLPCGLLPFHLIGQRNSDLLFDAVAAAPHLRRASARMNSAEVMELLRVPSLNPLLSGRLLTPIAVAEPRKSVPIEFERVEVYRLVDDMIEASVPVLKAEPGQVSIRTVAHQRQVTLAAVLRLVLEGRLAWVGRLDDGEGIAPLLVNSEEVRAALRNPDVEGLTRDSAHRRLKIRYDVFSRLVAKGVLATHRSVSAETGRPVDLVSEDEVERFEKTYVTLGTAARERGRHWMTFKKMLVDQNIHPALHMADFGTTFYLRSALP